MKILIPTDFSKNAKRAIDYALLLAAATKSSITLVHVYGSAVTRKNLSYPLIQDEIASQVKVANKKLTELCSEISDDKIIPCKQKVMVGEIVEEITNEAKVNKADMIIMGTQGASGIEKILFGSKTTSVIEKAPCPVLAIPQGAAIALPKRIVFATDYHDSDMRTLKSLTNLVERLNAELMILHVSKEKLKSERDLIEQFSKAVAKETGSQQPFYYVMSHEDTQKGIDLFVDSSGADMLALSTRKRSIFEKILDSSLTKKMAYQSRLPLLAFQSGKSNQDSFNEDF
ncbi:MAG: universal stress protein [Cyclobacteriaceae bacterium]|nr:universal stress protein [Cyclobacteriaceae bacterium]